VVVDADGLKIVKAPPLTPCMVMVVLVPVLPKLTAPSFRSLSCGVVTVTPELTATVNPLLMVVIEVVPDVDSVTAELVPPVLRLSVVAPAPLTMKLRF
jgi:hypothetical protein